MQGAPVSILGMDACLRLVKDLSGHQPAVWRNDGIANQRATQSVSIFQILDD